MAELPSRARPRSDTTPLFRHSEVRSWGWGGLMVTGSHNPPDENGFKIVLGQEPFHGARIGALENCGRR